MMYLNGEIERAYLNGYWHNEGYLGSVLVWKSGIAKARTRSKITVSVISRGNTAALSFGSASEGIQISNSTGIKIAPPVAVPPSISKIETTTNINGRAERIVLATTSLTEQAAITASAAALLVRFALAVVSSSHEISANALAYIARYASLNASATLQSIGTAKSCRSAKSKASIPTAVAVEKAAARYALPTYTSGSNEMKQSQTATAHVSDAAPISANADLTSLSANAAASAPLGIQCSSMPDVLDSFGVSSSARLLAAAAPDTDIPADLVIAANATVVRIDWEYPVQVGNELSITQLYRAVQVGNTLEGQ